MDYFLGIFYGNCDLRNVGGAQEFRKLGFRGLKGQLDVKKANFRGLIAKISHYRPILASKTHPWPVFLEYSMGIVTLGMLEGF